MTDIKDIFNPQKNETKALSLDSFNKIYNELSKSKDTIKSSDNQILHPFYKVDGEIGGYTNGYNVFVKINDEYKINDDYVVHHNSDGTLDILDKNNKVYGSIGGESISLSKDKNSMYDLLKDYEVENGIINADEDSILGRWIHLPFYLFNDSTNEPLFWCKLTKINTNPKNDVKNKIDSVEIKGLVDNKTYTVPFDKFKQTIDKNEERYIKNPEEYNNVARDFDLVLLSRQVTEVNKIPDKLINQWLGEYNPEKYKADKYKEKYFDTDEDTLTINNVKYDTAPVTKEDHVLDVLKDKIKKQYNIDDKPISLEQLKKLYLLSLKDVETLNEKYIVEYIAKKKSHNDEALVFSKNGQLHLHSNRNVKNAIPTRATPHGSSVFKNSKG